MKKIILLLFISTFFLSSVQSEEFIMTEKSLLQILDKSPETLKLNAELLGTESTYRSADDPFAMTLDGSASTLSSREESITGVPPTTKATELSLGLNKPLPYGVQLGVGYASQKVSNSALSAAARSQVIGKVSIDLFRDFLGRSSGSKLFEAKSGFKAGQLSNKINTKGLQLNVRSLFWNYAMAMESKLVASELLVSAEKQLRVVRRKRKSDVADWGDVSRFSSQVSERKAQILQFEGVMKEVEVQIKTVFPDLSTKLIKLGSYDKELAIKSFKQCLPVIGAHKKAPMQYTLVDELIEMKKKQLKYRRKAVSAYSDVDIKLDAQVGLVGNGFGNEASRDSITDDKNDFNSVGISVSLPIDKKRRSSERVQLKLAEAQFESEIANLSARLKAFHTTITSSVDLIIGVIDNRTKNKEFLRKALVDSRKKYRQARITSQQLLQEEDKYLSNSLQLINTQRELLQILFDYFALFTEAPCSLNKVI